MQTRKVIAFVTDLAPLKLDEMATRVIVGDHNTLKLLNGFLFVSEPRNWTAARDFLAGLGATVLPAPHDPVTQVGADAAAKFAGVVAATDVGFSAAQKLHAHFAWPKLNPLD